MEKVRIIPYTKYDESEIIPLYRAVGWSRYYENPPMLRAAFANSLYAAGAYWQEKLVGMIRAVGDGHSILYIQDLLVAPDYQRRGIGSLLLRDVLGKYDGVYQKVLLTDGEPRTIRFYKSLGFQPSGQFGCLAFLRFST